MVIDAACQQLFSGISKVFSAFAVYLSLGPSLYLKLVLTSLAASSGEVEMAKFFLDAGIKLLLGKARKGGQYSATASHTNGHLELFNLLLAKGADIKVKEGGNGSGWTIPTDGYR